ncbi:hypothetical protein PARPLA_00559 [Rhodobacteraceae bacterium THAF1]|uniref:dihydrodipicolinate reductase n=1 Tax=Palleronia sp. THAF1 TaxID=2587842 RepID=UPI000F3D6916|nr:dihydrodipicolinate reductase [Palleronia sp. THAF1]QFU09878.1 hypothetical protein FIU81_14465 [Palleronia sp. THAF1]VDC17219.1 hypothetical protein PARPLA_00559 [Rhodobacteraceae bacterium THAF1]
MKALTLALVALAAPAVAQDLPRIETRDAFIGTVAGKTLTTSGISIQATPGGQITGRGLGFNVTGSWTWQDGYFCREMSVAIRSWDMNCQAVYSDGASVRFIADRGQGDTADLSIR